MAPVLIAQLAERSIYLAHVFFDAFEIVESRTLPHVGVDAPDCNEWNERPDIIDDEPSDRRVRFRRQKHADVAAHRGPDPIDGFGAGARDKRRHVGKILCVIVIDSIGEPVALAAAHNIGAENLPPLAIERVRETIEIAPVARKAVHTDHRRLRRRLPPLGIVDAMKAAGTAAVELFFVHAG